MTKIAKSRTVRQRVYLSHPGVPGGHTWWLESSGALLARGGSILAKSLFLAVVLDVFTGCLSEKLRKSKKKWNFFFLLFSIRNMLKRPEMALKVSRSENSPFWLFVPRGCHLGT